MSLKYANSLGASLSSLFKHWLKGQRRGTLEPIICWVRVALCTLHYMHGVAMPVSTMQAKQENQFKLEVGGGQ